MKIKPDIIIGDFDSSLIPNFKNDKINIIKVNSIKDDTDTSLAIKYALRNNYKNIDIISALGNRLDHSIANIQLLKYILEFGATGRILNKNISIMTLKIGLNKIHKTKNKIFSIFSLSDESKIKYIKGSKYDIKNIILKNNFPIGISNEFIKKTVNIYVEKGVAIGII